MRRLKLALIISGVVILISGFSNVSLTNQLNKETENNDSVTSKTKETTGTHETESSSEANAEDGMKMQKYLDSLTTLDPSDEYLVVVLGKANADLLYELGWITKDDFSTYAQLLAGNDDSLDDAIESYTANSARFSRYLAEDTSGLFYFLDDCFEKSKELENSYVTKDENDLYKFDIDSMIDFSDSMEMTIEMAEIMMNALNDAGFAVDIK